jgi:hypothetical protein
MCCCIKLNCLPLSTPRQGDVLKKSIEDRAGVNKKNDEASAVFFLAGLAENIFLARFTAVKRAAEERGVHPKS